MFHFESATKVLRGIYNFGTLPNERFNHYQKIIRDKEWEIAKKYIPHKIRLLDIGCGTGYYLKRATEDLSCRCLGIDPQPYKYGINIEGEKQFRIYRAKAECLPFLDKQFEIVFSSHAMEHVLNKESSLKEMKRVLKDDGTIILCVPTATMACIGLLSGVIFTAHQRIIKTLLSPFFRRPTHKFIHTFMPPSHSDPNKTIFYDLINYRLKKWISVISKELKIKMIIPTALYPYPDYPQLFKIRRSKCYSSSVFFICIK